MLRTRLLALSLGFCGAGFAVSASERLQPAEPPGVEQQLRAGAVAPAKEGGDRQAGDFLPPPLPQLPPLTSDLVAPDFAAEFAERLAGKGARLTAADKADRAALLQFYADRRNEPVWLSEQGLTAAAKAVVREIDEAGDWGLDRSAFSLPALAPGGELTRAARADAEIEISIAVLKYARHARGGRADPLAISKNLDRKPPLLDPRQVIDTAASTDSPGAFLRSLHPQHPQFERLRRRYLALKRGEPVAALEQIAHGGAGASKKGAAKLSDAAMQRTLLANMEQWRWMPADLGRFHVWVNIPEFTLRVVAAGETVHSERVILGKPATQTPVFSDEMEQVIFHPFWGVPDSIKKNEILPSLARGDTGVLARNNLRIQYRGRDINPRMVDWSRADMRKFHVYQPPGADNVLGVVKFRFPNNHAVYIHDTPSKKLFNASVRTFSHGCMRVRDPLKLAALVLGHDRNWTVHRVVAAARSGPKNNQINLAQKIPVHITYFTAWVEQDGTLKTYGDIYGHEGRIALAVTGKAPQIARPRAKAVVAAARVRPRPQMTAQRPVRREDRDWAARLFNN
jgi:murein L,D-transpeptidase YcbB/YkuD